MSGQLAGLLLYSAGLIAFGVWIGRRVDSSGGFFVADRKLGGFLLFCTILAANIGAGSTVGAAGLGYRDGLSAWWWVGSAGIGTIVLALWVGPRIWRVASDNGLLTVGDFLEHRYGRGVRAMIAILLWLGTLAILAGQLIAMAEILQVVAGAPRWVGALIGGLVMTAYFSAGGLVASAWVNMVQLVVLVVGFAVAVPWALGAAGGWDAVVSAAPAVDGYLSLGQGGQSGWIYLALLGPAFIVSPGLLQKVYGAVDQRAIRTGLLAAGVALMIFAFAPALLGMVARTIDPSLVQHEQALPLVLTQGLPPILGLLGLAAVFSAEISSADAILFMLSTSLSKDLYKRFVRPDATDRDVLRVARWAAVAGGVLGVGLALVLPSVIGSLTIFYSLLSVSLFVPVVAGLYTRRPGVAEAFAAIGAGLLALLVARLIDTTEASRLFDPTLVGIVVSAIAFALVSLIRRSGEKEAG
ncbi:MAG: sodium:solute symporter family protein [Gemmatimonadota bacterium]|nr:sodium:solute symporter family protein [Gemmatimonadota bacterium]